MAKNSDGFEMACTFIHETDNAILINDPASGEDVWILLSAVIRMDRPKGGFGEGTIVMEYWLAHKRGFA